MGIIVPFIVIVIILLQVFFFVKNLKRMEEFGNIFFDKKKEWSWSVHRNSDTGLVDGIRGEGNGIFKSIVKSINKYLEHNTGSVIDFGLLKDAVDRHCDSVEDDITAQTPIPLYWGLAGTMAGVIIGLWDLLSSDAISTLMGSGVGAIDVNTKNAADGIDSLLQGVAWAMAASICGILLTTFNSILFKRCKLKEESGKNSFLAWMQSVLLPELPSDTSQAFNRFVDNLNKFNKTFARNMTKLDNVLQAINQSYAIQADVVEAVQAMDVMKMAKANVKVLQELQECTDKLEAFQRYLNDVEGYTAAIHKFEAQFGEQAERYHVLEEIRDFFGRHKQEISRSTADADKELQDALTTIRENTTEGVDELRKRLTEQSEQFKAILKEEKESFERVNNEITTRFTEHLGSIPHLTRKLEEISAIPEHLDRLISKMEKSHRQVISELNKSVSSNKYPAIIQGEGGSGSPKIGSLDDMPDWIKYVVSGSVVVIAVSCVFIVVNYFLN